MAHFARLENNVVVQVIVVNNEEVPDEATGIAFCKSLAGEDTEWIQTSYNDNFRGCFAGEGMVYDPDLDIFTIPTQQNPA
jgi:hypothetical protein